MRPSAAWATIVMNTLPPLRLNSHVYQKVTKTVPSSMTGSNFSSEIASSGSVPGRDDDAQRERCGERACASVLHARQREAAPAGLLAERREHRHHHAQHEQQHQ